MLLGSRWRASFTLALSSDVISPVFPEWRTVDVSLSARHGALLNPLLIERCKIKSLIAQASRRGLKTFPWVCAGFPERGFPSERCRTVGTRVDTVVTVMRNRVSHETPHFHRSNVTSFSRRDGVRGHALACGPGDWSGECGTNYCDTNYSALISRHLRAPRRPIDGVIGEEKWQTVK
ncbi:unnamed protein product [Lota lota]